MKVTQYIVKTAYRASGGSLLTDRCSGGFVSVIKRSAFLVVMLSVIVAFATGCSSTGAGSNATLISLIPANQRNANSEDGGGGYQPVRSPAFSDLFGS
jgi:hypothetical protein